MNRLLKISGECKGETILGPGNKPEGLAMKNGLILKLSFKKDCEFASVDAGEKNPVGTGGNIAGAGDKIPGIWPASTSLSISMRSSSLLSWVLLGLVNSLGLAFSVASC